MKYYLNESIKYILSEQFVLNEAMKHSELIVQCKTIYEYIKKLLDELENGTDDTNAKEDALNKILELEGAIKGAEAAYHGLLTRASHLPQSDQGLYPDWSQSTVGK